MRITTPTAHPVPAVVLAALVVAAATLAPASAHAQAAGAAKLELPAVETWTLDNGLQVAFQRVDGAPVVAVGVWYRAGSKDEPRERQGLARMFERLMFLGSERVRPGAHAGIIEGLGGYVDAAVSEDASSYLNVLPPAYLELAMALEAERMRGLRLRDDAIAVARATLQDDVRRRERWPLAQGIRRFLHTAYTKHPYAWPATGTVAGLGEAGAEELRRFYDAYYVPNNATLVVVGAVAVERVRAAVQTHFGALARAAEPPRPAAQVVEPALTEARRQVAEAGQVGIVLAGYHIPGAAHGDLPALQVAGLVLGLDSSARLSRRLVRTDKIAVEVGVPLFLRQQAGLVLMFAAFVEPAAAGPIEQAMRAEIDALRRAGPTAQELSKAKSQLQARLAFSLEDVGNLARQIGAAWILTDDPGRWQGDLARFAAVSAADVKRVVASYLVPDKQIVVVVPPLGAASAPQ
ncbi:M16 family metallopeptidase [Haliangium sp.]|uniref:M16 family metallopeptidase n=1 Tax=Haliangium sp. TaxID=2663208 RepID=UPI003D10E090